MPTYPPNNDVLTSASSPVTSSLVTAIPVPTYGPGGNFSVLTKAFIPAPPLEVLSLIRDIDTWPTWNTFCPSCTIKPVATLIAPNDPSIITGKPNWLELGTEGSMEVFMNGDGLVPGKKASRTQGLVVTCLEKVDEDGKKGYRIAWKGVGFAKWQLHSERVMEFVECPMEDGKIGTAYVCWETFAGILGPVVKATVGGQLIDRFGDYSRDLMEYFAKKNVTKNESGVGGSE